ncbi:DUF4440 domain-containing protein [Salinibacterium sp. GXW1014]|uniref:nuclear transport factor 2 family protein n=1 Tax=Salinibacterium sp. GXW1014 TaxID=3377838 RepID=UPI00383AE255
MVEDARARQILESELRLLTPQLRSSPAEVEELLAPEFIEIGQSGRLWSRSDIVAALADPEFSAALAAFEITEERVVLIAGDHYLLTYLLVTQQGRSRRSSIWKCTASGYRMAFHQGTPVG